MKHKELRAALVEAGWRFAKQVQSPDSLNQCDWFFTLLTWAGERRRRAAELMRAGTQQKELFE